jgi:hypothetical protein
MPVKTNVICYLFTLELSSMAILNIKELTTICSLTSKQILAYYRDVMLENFPAEQAAVTRYLVTILHLMSKVGSIRADPDHVPFLKIIDFSLTAVTDEVKTEIPFKLEPQYFQILGPIGMMKLLRTVFNSALTHIQLEPLTPSQAVTVKLAETELAIMSNALAKIALRIPDSSVYSVTSTSELYPIVIRLEIKFNTRN